MLNRRRFTSVAAAGALTLGSVIAIGAAPTVADAATICSDTTAPKLQDLKLSRKSVDVRHGSATINVTSKWKDDLSGITSVSINAGSPTFHGISRGTGASLKRTAGTSTDGTFSGKLTIPEFTIAGTWTIALFAYDKVSNVGYYSSAQLITDGLQGKFKVQSNPDVSPPKVSSFSFSPKTVDSRNGNKSFTVTAKVTDKGGSKVSSVFASFGRSVPGKGNYGTSASLQQVGSSSKYVGHAVVNKYDDRDVKATWLASLSTSDHIGNYQSYTSTEIAHKHWPSKLKILNKGDSKAPQLKDFNFSPKTDSVASSSAVTNLTARVTDDRSGVSYGSLSFQGPSFETSSGFLSPSGGSSTNAQMKGKSTLAICSTPGAYNLNHIQIFDAVGNYQSYTGTQVQNMGFPIKLTITS